MKAVVIEGDALLISRQALGKMVDFKTIDKGTERFRKGESQSWKFKKIGGGTWIYIDSIPTLTRAKVAKALEEWELSQAKQSIAEEKEAQKYLYKVMHRQVGKYGKYAQKYIGKGYNDENATKSGKKWALLRAVVCLNNRGYTLTEIHNAYKLLKEKPFVCNQYIAFTQKVKDFKEKPFETCKHGNIGNTNNGKYDINSLNALIYIEQRAESAKLPMLVKMMLVNDILEENGKSIFKRSSYERLANSPKVRNLVLPTQNKHIYENKLKRFLSRKPATMPLQIVEIDGTKLQFYGKDENGDVKRYTIFVAIDVFSKKVLAFEVAEIENRKVVLDTLEKMYYENGMKMPNQIVSDNFSVGKTKEYNNFKEICEMVGLNFRQCRVGNAKDKNTIEYFFKYFQEHGQALLPFFLGFDIKSKQHEKRPDAEYLNKANKHLLDKAQIQKTVGELITMYNKERLVCELSPYQLFEQTKKAGMVVLENAMRYAFWQKTSFKMDRDFVRIQYQKKKYEFSTYNYDIQKDYNGVEVEIRFNPNDMSKVYLYDMKTKLIIGSAVPPNLVERTPQTAEEFEVLRTETNYNEGYVPYTEQKKQYVMENSDIDFDKRKYHNALDMQGKKYLDNFEDSELKKIVGIEDKEKPKKSKVVIIEKPKKENPKKYMNSYDIVDYEPFDRVA